MNNFFEVLVQLIPLLVSLVFIVVGIDLYLKLRVYLQLKTQYYKNKLAEQTKQK